MTQRKKTSKKHKYFLVPYLQSVSRPIKIRNDYNINISKGGNIYLDNA